MVRTGALRRYAVAPMLASGFGACIGPWVVTKVQLREAMPRLSPSAR